MNRRYGLNAGLLFACAVILLSGAVSAYADIFSEDIPL